MAWLFDSTSDSVVLSDNAVLTLPDGDWTIAGWVKLASTSASLDIYPLRHDRVSGDGYEIRITSNGSATDEVYFLVQSDNGTFIDAISASSPFSSNTDWTHLVLQRSGDTVTLYVDTASVASASNASLDAVNPDENLYLGNRDNADRNLNGSLAEWAKWDRALSTTEIGQLYDGGAVAAVALAPSYLPTNLSWYVPMHSGDYTEKIAGLTVTNNGTTGATHPVVRYPLTMPLLSNSPTLHAPTLDPTYTLVAPHLSSSLSLLAPTLTQDATGQTLEVPLLSVAPSLFSPGFVYAQSISGPFHSIAPTLFAPTLVNAAALGVPLLSVAPSLFAPTLDPEVILFVPHLASTLSLFAPSLSPNLTPPVLSIAPTLYGPTLFAQYTLELPVINVSPSLYSPVILGLSFPQIQSVVESQFSTSTTSHDVTMPAVVNEGDLLLAFVSIENAPTPTITTPSGWVLVDSSYNPSPAAARLSVYRKTAAGDEGGGVVDFVTSGGSVMAAQVYRITGWSEVEAGTASTGSGASPDSPPFSPSWGTEATLWFAVLSAADDDATVTAYQPNYSGGRDTISGGGTDTGCTVASSYRENLSASEDPGAFTLSESETWTANTVAVRPTIAPKFITAPRLELAPNLLPPTLLLDATQQIVAPLLSLTTTFYPPTLKRIWELVTPNSGTPFSLVTPSSSTDFTLIG